MRRTLAVTALTIASLAVSVAPATADRPAPETFPLVCDDGQEIEVSTNGAGAFTPARLVGSTAVFVPVSFGPFTFTAELPDGSTVTETDPALEQKGGGNVLAHSPRATTTCTYSASETLEEDDPDSGFPAGTVLTFTGVVTGYLTGG